MIPVICIGLFVIHPVGRQAFVYSFFWFIPFIIFYMGLTHLYARALATTFIVHAVGSVIWLYTFEISAATWLSLIPVVCIERCMFAGLLALAAYVLTSVSVMWSLRKKTTGNKKLQRSE